MREPLRPPGLFDIYVMRDSRYVAGGECAHPVTFRRIRQALIREAAWVGIATINECEVLIAYRAGSHVDLRFWQQYGLGVFWHAYGQPLRGQWAPGTLESDTFQ